MKPFDVIAADPAWSFGDRLTMSDVKRGAASQYPVLDADAIRDLPVRALAAPDAVLLLWVPASLLHTGMSVMDAWGFRQTQVVVWYKADPRNDRIAFGMGRLFRSTKELALVGVRGSPYRSVADRAVRDVFVHPRLPHSQKPEAVQDALDRMFPTAHRLELFARRARPGWECVGLDAPDTAGQDIRDVLPSMARLVTVPER